MLCPTIRSSMLCHHAVFQALPPNQWSSMLCPTRQRFPCSALRGLLCQVPTVLCQYEVFHVLPIRGLPCSATVRSSMLFPLEVFHDLPPRGLPCSGYTRPSTVSTATTRPSILRLPRGLPCSATTRSSMLFPWRSSMLRLREVFHAFPLEVFHCLPTGGLLFTATTRPTIL
jgi:hypothetical protein